jgi:hypothetical protein
MKRLSVFVLFFSGLFTLGSCSQSTNTDNFDNSKVKIDDMRAREKQSTIALEEKTAVIELKEHEAISSYTELVQGKLNTIVEVEKDSEVRLTVIDGDGRMLKSFSQASRAGKNEYQLDFSDLSMGQYYVVVLSDNFYRRFCVAKTNEG